MEGDVATAVAFEELDTSLGEELGGRNYIRRFRVAAQCDDWRVFEQEKHVADLFFFAEGDELLLQAKARGVINGAELD